ncbi:helix-turn-helix domain-containing protein [Lapidilactobacillus dextrinicus]|uniref:helix-turn-helix domain-containing protein n=1 Tax=Lapidilactobacillus dextrinicus TaxID=51664 RepID=UPI003F1EBA6C
MNSQKILQDNVLSLYAHTKLSLSELADRCGIGATTLVGIMNGNHSTMLETLDRMADKLNVTTNDLITANYANNNWQEMMK